MKSKAQKLVERIEKLAASKRVAGYQQTRKGRRPIRVSTLLKKKASLPGQDLRLPVMGGTKFPTKDSLTGPKSLLTKSIGSAEAGPSPSIKQLSPGGPTIKDVAAVPPGAPNLMPKVGSDMSHIENDPLVLYLQKQAAEDIPRKVTPEKGGVLTDNVDDMPTGPEEKERTSEDPHPTEDLHRAGMGYTKSTLSDLFDHTSTKKKCKDKDHAPDTGAVDRILALK